MACNEWVVEQGLPEGEFFYEITDPKTNEVSAIFDIAWPNGLQEGLSRPVALIIDKTDKTVEDAANKAEYLYFTSIEEFKDYVRKEILAEEETTGA